VTAPIGPVVTDWVSYNLVIGATTTAPTPGTVNVNQARWRRVGDSMEIIYNFEQGSAGTAGSGDYLFPLPTGYSVDTSKLLVLNPARTIVGNAKLSFGLGTSGANTPNASVLLGTTNPNAFKITYPNTTIEGTFTMGSGGFGLNAGALSLSFYAQIPIQGWSSSVQMSNDTDTRVVSLSAGRAQAAVTGGANITGFTTLQDTHGAFNSSTGIYTIPVTGDYVVAVSGALPTIGSCSISTIYDGSGVVFTSTGTAGATRGVSSALLTGLPAGKTISFRSDTSVTLTAELRISIHRLSGPSVVAASETVACHVETSAGPTITTGSGSAVSFPTKVYDTHNAFSGNTYTVPVSGKYRITALLTMVNTSVTAVMFSDIYVNGTLSKNLTAIYPYLSNLNNHRINGSVTLNLNAGQTVQLFAGSGTAIALFPSAAYNYFIIERVGQ
jgi:hypothetical protein